MLRILVAVLFGYWAYRIVREFVDSVPDDFEIVVRPDPVPERGATRRTNHRLQ